MPLKVLSNSDFEKMVDTTDEWIMKRTGIKTRHVVSEGEVTSDLAAKACEQAISRSGLIKSDIQMLICATITPDYLCMPSTACIVAEKLGLKNIPAFDISAACSGFIYLLSLAKAFIESGAYKNILIVGAESMSRIVDYSDRATCVLFGDGAGAAVVSTTEDKAKSILDVKIAADGEYRDFLVTPGGGSAHPATHESVDEGLHFVKMKGNETFKIAVRTLAADVEEMLLRNEISSDAIDHFIPHQANLRIIDAVAKAISIDESKVVLTVQKYGNTSAASIPMAINDAYESGELKKGEMLLLDAFGGGLTWGSALVRFMGDDIGA